MDAQKYRGLLDMLDGGGMGRSGQKFEGGLFSGLLNALGVNPMGYQQRMEEARPMARPQGFMQPQQAPQAPQAPQGDVTTTPLIGNLTPDQIKEAITRGAPPPYAQPIMPPPPSGVPSMADLMEMERRRREAEAVFGFEMGRAYPNTYR